MRLPWFTPADPSAIRRAIIGWLARHDGQLRLGGFPGHATAPLTEDPFLMLPLAGWIAIPDGRMRPGDLLWMPARSRCPIDVSRSESHLRLTLGPEVVFAAIRRGDQLHGAMLGGPDLPLVRALADALPRADAESHRDLARACLRLVVALAPSRLIPGRTEARLISAYLSEHLDAPCSRADIARIFGIHPNHLARLCRRELGESFRDHLHRLRMRRGLALRRTGMRADEAARACGYASWKSLRRTLRVPVE